MNEIYQAPKYKFREFIERQGWFLLYDKINDEGSEISYMSQNVATAIARFDKNGNFTTLVDVNNERVSLTDDNFELGDE